MAQVSKSATTLRIGGDNLAPDKITEILGCEPTQKQIKDQVFIGKTTGRERIAKTGMWRLEVADREPENLDEQISKLLSKLSDNLDSWNSISEQYEIDLFCGLFMDNSNEGLSISSDSLKSLGLRGIELSLDIYGPCEE